MGKTGSWMHSIRKAVHNHLHGDLDPYKFQHLPTRGTVTTPRAQSDCSTASSHVGEQYLEDRQSGSSTPIVGGSDHKQEERRRFSTSSQVLHGGSGNHKKSPKHDEVPSSRSDIASSQASGGSGRHTYEELLKDGFPLSSSRSSEKGSGHHKIETNDSAQQSREQVYTDAERSSGDHSHLVKLYREERAGLSPSYNPFYDRSNKEENGRSSTSSEKGRRVDEELSRATASEKENPRYSTGGRGGHTEEKRRPSISSQKEKSGHEKPPLEKGRLSNASSTHNERTILEKAMSSTSSNHNVKTSLLSSDARWPSTPPSPDDRTKSLLNENWKIPSENRRSIDKGRPKTPSSPRITFMTSAVPTETTVSEKSISTAGPAASQQLKSPSCGTLTPASPYPQQGRSIALQDLLKPPSFERKSSSGSTTSAYQAGGSTRSITSKGSHSSDDFLELVFPLSDTMHSSPSREPPASTNQRKRVVIATIQDLFSSHQYEAPVSPGSQRRKSGNFTPKPVVSMPELGTKPLLPPNYRKQQAAAAVTVADLGAVMFHPGGAGAGGMLGEWAAVMIQSSWRRYIARRSFKALRGLLKLQALVRGFLVRKKIKPLVNARLQSARVRNKLSRNSKIQLHHVSNNYSISQTLLKNQSCGYGSAQPVLDDSPAPATRKSSRTRDPLKCDVSEWNSPVTLCTLAELKQQVFMKRQRAKEQQQSLSSGSPRGQTPELLIESISPP